MTKQQNPQRTTTHLLQPMTPIPTPAASRARPLTSAPNIPPPAGPEKTPSRNRPNQGPPLPAPNNTPRNRAPHPPIPSAHNRPPFNPAPTKPTPPTPSTNPELVPKTAQPSPAQQPHSRTRHGTTPHDRRASATNPPWYSSPQKRSAVFCTDCSAAKTRSQMRFVRAVVGASVGRLRSERVGGCGWGGGLVMGRYLFAVGFFGEGVSQCRWVGKRGEEDGREWVGVGGGCSDGMLYRRSGLELWEREGPLLEGLVVEWCGFRVQV